MRVRLKGINSLTKRLADGQVVTYWYAWKGGPRLHGQPGSPEFIASYNEAVSRKVTPPAGVMFSVLQGYQASRDFLDLSKRTRDDYIGKIKQIEKEFGDFPLSALADRRTRGVFLAWRDKLAHSSRRQADYSWAVLARVLSWALNRGLIAANPCEKGGRLYGGTRADKIWSTDDEANQRTYPPSPGARPRAMDRSAPGRPVATSLVQLRRHTHPPQAVQGWSQSGGSGWRAAQGRARRRR